MPLAVGWSLALVAVAAFCSLGYWQLSRGEQKQAMLGEVEGVLARRDARPLASASDEARLRSYDWAAGEGHFLELPPVLLDNQIRESRPGLRVYRVFQPAAGGLPLLVDMGWLPLPGDRRLPALDAPPQATRIEGLLAPAPSAGLATPSASATPQGVLAIGLDPGVVAEALGLPALAVRVLKLDPASPLGYARDLDILPNTLPPDRHLGYAVQWFGLALAVLVVALVLSLRRRGR
jgi:cytochrome oxidase assembly protein ShyY1